MKEHDCVLLAVQFYDNFGRIDQVSSASGVGILTLRKFLETGILNNEDRKKLENSMAGNKGN